MRWIAAITTCLLLSIAASGLTIAGASTAAVDIDAEVEATLDPTAERAN